MCTSQLPDMCDYGGKGQLSGRMPSTQFWEVFMIHGPCPFWSLVIAELLNMLGESQNYHRRVYSEVNV